MIDNSNINWTESQNSFSKLTWQKKYYEYNKGYQVWKHELGCFCYTINGEIKISAEKALNSSGIVSDGNAYYWHYFDNACCFEKTLNYDSDPRLKNNRFIVNRINVGKWDFNHNVYACITRAIIKIKSQLNANQYLVVLFPLNKMIEKQAQYKYHSEFIELLKQDCVTYVVGDISKVKEKEKQLVVIVIDIVTSMKRKNYIINDIRKKKANQKPIVAMYSLMMIFDEMSGKFFIELGTLRTKQDEKKKMKKTTTFTRETPTIDEEELIMRSLAGYGIDPEKLGF